MALSFFTDDLGKYIYLVPRDNFSGAAPTFDKKDDVIILSATEEFSRTDSASITEYPVSSGSRHTDHYRVEPATVTFSGVISPKLLSVFSAAEGLLSGTKLDNLKSPVQRYLDRIVETMITSTKTGKSPLFFVHLPDKRTIENGVITAFSSARDSLVSDGYRIDITVQEVLFADTKFSIETISDTVTPGAGLTNDTGVTHDQPFENPITPQGKIN